MAEEAAPPPPTPSAKTGAAAADLPPPRELVTLLAAAIALGCAALVAAGGYLKWTSPTLGVLLILGGVESLVAVALVAACALAEQRQKGPFVLAIVFTTLAVLALAGILVLSGMI
ncbi:MAG: hypothetical protein ACAI25_19550 [Planctomycetota bacterium]